MSDRSSTYQPGDVFAGKYRIDGVLGSGGMGVVLAASHLTLGERVAIKVLHELESTNAQNVGRLVREARAAARLKGEHGVRILDVATLEGGVPFIIMEHLSGEDIARIVERGGPLPVRTAVDYVLQACEALAEAHALGIVHRDVKPSNVFVARRPDGSECVKVLDFGISKLTSPLDTMTPDYGMTQTRETMGTPQYMAPEQMRSSRKVDARADIWGLGTLLFVSLTGRSPFEADALPELCAMILEDPTPSLCVLRADVPAELDAIVQQCLMKRPNERPQSALELARKLTPFASFRMAVVPERIERVLERLGTGEIPSSMRGEPSHIGRSDLEAAATVLDVPQTRRLRIPWRAGIVIALLLGVAGGGAFFIGRRARARDATTATLTTSATPTTTGPTKTTDTPIDWSPLPAPPTGAPADPSPSASVAHDRPRPNRTGHARPRESAPQEIAPATPPAVTASPPKPAPSATATSRFD